MSRHEVMPFKMIVERGKLIPATQHDAERLDTWRNGTAVNVTFVRDGGRVMERKWWAILNRAIKECRTPWKTSSAASEAIKLSIGVINYTKTVGGDFLAYPKSLTELDDPDLDEAVRMMIDVIHNITGVDPEEWRKQVEHIKDEQQTSEGVPSPGATDEGSDGHPALPSAVAADQPADAADQEGGAPVTSEPDRQDHGDPAAPPSTLSGADREWLKTAAKFLMASAVPGGDVSVLRNQYGTLLKHMTPPAVSQLAIAKAVTISKHLAAVCEQTVELDRDLIAGWAGCDVRELAS